MGAFGSIGAAIFGVFWTMTAASMGAPVFFVMFGVVFVILGIGQAVYNFKNATGKNRFSEFDITDEKEESDPLNEYFGNKNVESVSREKASSDRDASGPVNFCPFCGAEVENGYQFCAKCGKELPQ